MKSVQLTHYQKSPPIDVILGVDVFERQAAVIDYGTSSLFLKDAALSEVVVPASGETAKACHVGTPAAFSLP